MLRHNSRHLAKASTPKWTVEFDKRQGTPGNHVQASKASLFSPKFNMCMTVACDDVRGLRLLVTSISPMSRWLCLHNAVSTINKAVFRSFKEATKSLIPCAFILGFVCFRVDIFVFL